MIKKQIVGSTSDDVFQMCLEGEVIGNHFSEIFRTECKGSVFAFGVLWVRSFNSF